MHNIATSLNTLFAENKWDLVLYAAALFPLAAVIWHICKRKEGLTTARLFLTFTTFLYFWVASYAHTVFGYFDLVKNDDIIVGGLCGVSVLLTALLPLVYRRGLKVLRIILSVLRPIALVVVFVGISFVDFYAVREIRAEGQNKDFATLTQEEKNEYYTQKELKRATGIAFPEFDVVKHEYTVMGPDMGFEYVLEFHEPLPASVLERLEEKVGDGTWKRVKDGYVLPNEYGYEAFGDGIYVYPSSRRVRLYRYCH